MQCVTFKSVSISHQKPSRAFVLSKVIKIILFIFKRNITLENNASNLKSKILQNVLKVCTVSTAVGNVKDIAERLFPVIT